MSTKILVVDDEEDLCEILKFNLEIEGYEVDTALIGGMVIRMGDRVVDSSIRTKLYNLSKELYHIPIGMVESGQ